ncbi:hypothetical protein HD554DRAFT_1046955 [Boletus coccyginus]|nr:hypothetical protein HD554DRAFT_1434142 [Boletus coccyginus]KAI9567044.1 hypothetical protein HD554DRAFT_1046955 [Boletus coccyginus]
MFSGKKANRKAEEKHECAGVQKNQQVVARGILFGGETPLSGVVLAKNGAAGTCSPSRTFLFPLLRSNDSPAINLHGSSICAKRTATLDLLLSRERSPSRRVKSSALAHYASRSLCTAKIPQRRQTKGGSSCGICRRNRTVKNSMLLIAASHTHVLSCRHVLVPRSRRLRLHSVFIHHRVWRWRSRHNARGRRGFSHVKLLRECLDSLQNIHTTEGTSGWLIDEFFAAPH